MQRLNFINLNFSNNRGNANNCCYCLKDLANHSFKGTKFLKNIKS